MVLLHSFDARFLYLEDWPRMGEQGSCLHCSKDRLRLSFAFTSQLDCLSAPAPLVVVVRYPRSKTRPLFLNGAFSNGVCLRPYWIALHLG
jgi:hypothetical protein